MSKEGGHGNYFEKMCDIYHKMRVGAIFLNWLKNRDGLMGIKRPERKLPGRQRIDRTRQRASRERVWARKGTCGTAGTTGGDNYI